MRNKNTFSVKTPGIYNLHEVLRDPVAAEDSAGPDEFPPDVPVVVTEDSPVNENSVTFQSEEADNSQTDESTDSQIYDTEDSQDEQQKLRKRPSKYRTKCKVREEKREKISGVNQRLEGAKLKRSETEEIRIVDL